MDHIEARCVFDFEVGILNRLKESNICVLTIDTLRIAMLTVHHDMIFSVCSISDPKDSWEKHQQMSFPAKNVAILSPKTEISAVVHLEFSLQTKTQHRTGLVQIAWRLAIRATSSYAQQDSSCVEQASLLLRMPFWLEANYIFLRSSHFISLSSSSLLPAKFRYHHLFISTAANHGSTHTSARWDWNRIKQNDGQIIQYATLWDPATMQTPLSSPRHCECSHRKYDPGHIVKNCPSNQTQHEWDAAHDRISV